MTMAKRSHSLATPVRTKASAQRAAKHYRLPIERKPTARQKEKYGPRGGRRYTVTKPAAEKPTVSSAVSMAGPEGAGIAAALQGLKPTPSGGFGRSLFLLIVAGFTLYLIFSGHWSSVIAALQGKGALTTSAVTSKAGATIKKPAAPKPKT